MTVMNTSIFYYSFQNEVLWKLNLINLLIFFEELLVK